MLLLTITNTTWIIIAAAAALVVGLAVGYFITATLLKKAVTKEEQALLEEAKEKAEVIKKERILQAKEKFLQMKDEHEKACDERNRAAQKVEQKANQLKQEASQKMDEAQRKSKEVQAAQQKLESQIEAFNKKKADLDRMHAEAAKKLETISGLSAKEAKAQLIEHIKEEAQADAMVYVKEVRGSIAVATPSALVATGWNLYDHTNGYARVVKYSNIYGYAISGTYSSLVFKVNLSDAGTPINPELALCQMYGAALKSIGHSLYEGMILDNDGVCLNANMTDYGVPMIFEQPDDFRAVLIDVDDPYGPFGAKSISEIACNGAAPAIGIAIHDACGVWLRSWPMTPEKLLRALGRI